MRLSAASRREQLLSVAIDEFGRRGFHLTQMEHVAAAAGVSKALLYQHFESKEELFAAVTGAIVEGLSAQLHAATNPGDPGLDRMRVLAKTLFDFATHQPSAWAVIIRHFDKPEVGDELRGLRDDLGAIIADLMLLNRRNNPTRLARAEPVVTLLAPMVTGGMMSLISWWLDHPEVSRERAESMAVEFIWLGLERIRAGEHLTSN
ncbi:TetR/AcrR family transcriptional regulator [Cryptosporangium phraense]|uniref:TetR/AcrR family transcriptional regulator n=1 Tax=Cryptosporangium phraense TaxID=2593070 RepID=A0A545AH12_9ACTN|nr:TetR/AcrR family transcriptional regulator [Cryptosporangium phraense]TQS40601.1 TetR/AcrR family transcriptional regulator [Cryptosporangium phraense]